jgi:hypothetical protein
MTNDFVIYEVLTEMNMSRFSSGITNESSCLIRKGHLLNY